MVNALSAKGKNLAGYLAVLAWALAQFLFGNRFYVVLIIAILLLARLFTKKAGIYILTFALLLFFSPISDTLTALRGIDFGIVKNPQQQLREVLSPGTGKGSLPGAVKEAQRFIDEQKLGEYAISPGLSADALVHQRIVESVWPVRINPASEWMFCALEEGLAGDDWETIRTGQEVKLVRRR